jgi:hypothetical protein
MMESMEISGNLADQSPVDTYDKPELKRLGSFRELTQCGSIWDILFGRVSPRDCGFHGSSRYTWHPHR